MQPTKEELLDKYSDKPLTQFLQIDVHDVGLDSWDYVLSPDEHGLSQTSGIEWELMDGPIRGVRILVKPTMPIEKLRLALGKVLDRLDRSYAFMNQELFRKAMHVIPVYPNPNHEGFSDSWVCEHIPCQPAKKDNETWLCEECADESDAGAEIQKVGTGVYIPPSTPTITPEERKRQTLMLLRKPIPVMASRGAQ